MYSFGQFCNDLSLGQCLGYFNTPSDGAIAEFFQFHALEIVFWMVVVCRLCFYIGVKINDNLVFGFLGLGD